MKYTRKYNFITGIIKNIYDRESFKLSYRSRFGIDKLEIRLKESLKNDTFLICK